VLLATRCRDCGASAPGVRRACPNCTSRAIEAIECAQSGTLVSHTVVHRAAQSWSGRVPYVLGEVELPQRVVVTAEIVGAAVEALRCGAPMRLWLEVLGGTGGSPPLVIHRWVPDHAGAECKP
jgi:uncharacterized OB-fold protein